MALVGKVQTNQDLTIINDPFWPGVSVEGFNLIYNTGNVNFLPIIKTYIELALDDINHQLNSVKIKLSDVGCIEYLDSEVGGFLKVGLRKRYEVAIYSHAKSHLIKSCPAISQRKETNSDSVEDSEQLLEISKELVRRIKDESSIGIYVI